MPRQRKCPCGQYFTPRNSLQKACCLEGALIVAGKVKDKAKRKRLREGRERLKTLGDYAREAQRAFNAYIRERDRALPCISCGRHHNGQFHAGHFRTVASSPELRFEEKNCHKQCAPCNNHKSGDIVNYRINLVERIGIEQVEWLEGPHEPKRYRKEDLIAIRDEYRRKLRELKDANSDLH